MEGIAAGVDLQRRPGLPIVVHVAYMLDMAAKLLERMLTQRFQSTIGSAGDLFHLQHGFRKEHSTFPAIYKVVGTVPCPYETCHQI